MASIISTKESVERLNKFKRDRLWTNKQLAEASGISRQSIQTYTKVGVPISYRALAKLKRIGCVLFD